MITAKTGLDQNYWLAGSNSSAEAVVISEPRRKLTPETQAAMNDQTALEVLLEQPAMIKVHC
ncbi:hypothetical protein [Marinomonas fungiae]|uniref:hypothetical protein n=1 Tax=Marinomonas fungiae TaxID=1137284 RepID=UPI003A8F462E